MNFRLTAKPFNEFEGLGLDAEVEGLQDFRAVINSLKTFYHIWRWKGAVLLHWIANAATEKPSDAGSENQERLCV